jgi:hypothetical protein
VRLASGVGGGGRRSAPPPPSFREAANMASFKRMISANSDWHEREQRRGGRRVTEGDF